MVVRRVLETAFRNLRWLALSLVLVPLAAAILTAFVFRSYEATATVWVEASSAITSSDPTGSKTPADLYVSTLQQLLLTRAFREDVLRGVATRAHIAIPPSQQHDAWLKHIGNGIKATARGANLIEIRYRHANPAIATDTISAVLASFQTTITDLQTQAAAREARSYQDELQKARNDVAEAQQRISTLPPTAPAAVRSQAELDLADRRSLLTGLEDRRTSAFSEAVGNLVSIPGSLQVIDPPRIDSPAGASLLDLALAVTCALLLTMAADLGVILFLTFSDRTIRTASDLAPLVNAPVAELPRLASLENTVRYPRLRQRLLHE